MTFPPGPRTPAPEAVAEGGGVMTRILIVEDDPNQSLLYREGLESEEYEILTARDGRGSTPADTAMANGNEGIAERLRALEAVDED